MLDIQLLHKADAREIIRWNEGQDADFLTQWAGIGYTYPITIRQVIDRLDASFYGDYRIYGIQEDNKLLGTIELMRIDPIGNTGKLGRFLIDPLLRGKGYGTEVLKCMVDMCFGQFGYRAVGLTVFDFNKAALRCYEKAGFHVVNRATRPNGWVAVSMEIENPRRQGM